MTNREVLTAILERFATGTEAQREVYEECVHQRDIDMEDGPAFPDLAGALLEAESRFQENGERAWLKAAREAQIEAGFYRVMSEEEIANTTTTRGTVWSFKLGGKPYTWDSRYEDWLDKPAREKAGA